MKKLSLAYKLILYTFVVLGLYMELFSSGTLFVGGFAYFTVQSNMLVLASLFLFIVSPEHSRTKCIIRGISLIAIIVTGIIFNFVINGGFAWYGFFLMITHIIAPIGYVVDWILFDKHGQMKWTDVIIWLIYPLIYCSLLLLAGVVSGFAIYAFIDLAQGFDVVGVRIILVLCGAIAVSLAIVGLDKVLAVKERKK